MLTKAKLDSLLWDWRKGILIITAVRMRLFDLLAPDGKKLEDIANEASLNQEKLRLILVALSSIGLITKQKDIFKNSELSKEFLLSTSNNFIGGIINLNERAIDNWLQIEEVLKSGEPIASKESSFEEQTNWRKTFLSAMQELSKDKVDKVVSLLPLLENQTIIDIGAGPCSYLINILNKFKNVDCIAFDLPESKEYISSLLLTLGLDQKIKIISADALDYDFGIAKYNLIIISQFLHIIGSDKSYELLQKLHRSLKPSGSIAIQEIVAPDDNQLNEGGLFAVQMAIGTENGTIFSKQELVDLIEKSNLRSHSYDMVDERSALLIGSKK
ncbi:MAG: methyltransferase [Nitrospinota bacterium]